MQPAELPTHHPSRPRSLRAPARVAAARAVVIAALVLTAACGTDDGVGRPGGPSARGTVSEGPAPVSAGDSAPPAGADAPTGGAPSDGVPAFPRGTKDQYRPSSPRSLLLLTDVRTAAHDGFDRIVLEFSGKGTPGWAVNYVDKARRDGSGTRVALGGDAILDVYAGGTTWPSPYGENGPPRLDPETGGTIDDVYVVGTFEGDTQVLVGINGDRAPFRVFTLTSPTRLVVDVAATGSG